MFRASKPSRSGAREDMKRLANEFSDFYVSKGYTGHPPVLISSGIDPSVYLIGSHISVLKPYISSGSIPVPGYVIVQDCIRTQNLMLYRSSDKDFNWASFFTSMGLLAPPARLREVGIEMIAFLRSVGIHELDIRLRISSKDRDLVEACADMKHRAEIDTRPDSYYRHNLGFNDIFGRNYNICLRTPGTEGFVDVGNVILIEKSGIPIAVELALGSSTILKQVHGLSHIMECFDITGLETVDPLIRRKMEDAILVSLILYKEGLRPGQNGKRRLLGQYVKTVSYYRTKAGIERDALFSILAAFEKSEFPMSGKCVSQEIMEYMTRFENKASLHRHFFSKFK
jgi:hypothetical protein